MRCRKKSAVQYIMALQQEENGAEAGFTRVMVTDVRYPSPPSHQPLCILTVSRLSVLNLTKGML